MPSEPFELDHYTVRRKILKLFGGGFFILDGSEQLVGYSEQQAFRLKEDITVYRDQARTAPLLRIRARQVIDFAACYDVVDVTDGSVVGSAQRKGFSSLVRDAWELHGPDGGLIAQLQEDSLGLALLRRFLANLVPQRFHIGAGSEAVQIEQRFNPFVYKLDVRVGRDSTLDRRLVMAVAVLLAAIEGRQD